MILGVLQLFVQTKMKLKYSLMALLLSLSLASVAQTVGGIPFVSGTDDWFIAKNGGTGRGIIDTTGAAYWRNYFGTNNTATYNTALIRKSAYKLYTPLNGNLLIGAVYGRDQIAVNGGSNPDSTIFTSLPSIGASKNGMNPRYWKAEPSSVPAKNDLVDVYTAFRRGGPTVNDSLWLLGSVVTVASSGDRFFDFEYIQDTIKLNKTTGRFTYGPDTGHTAWVFDATTGDATKIGDVIFAADFGSSGLTNAQLRIWTRYSEWRNYNAKHPGNKLKFLIPSSGGEFDGPNGGNTFTKRNDTFGYATVDITGASILYNMTDNTGPTPGPPWGAKDASNNRVDNYAQNAYLDFAVNFTSMGVDPTILFSDPCAPIYNSFMAKSRASTSFTSDLKDLVGPLDFRVASLLPINASTDTITCNSPLGLIVGQSAAADNYYAPYWKWTANSGSGFVTSGGTPISGDTLLNDSAYINKPGTYTVSISKFNGCAAEGTKTITVLADTATPPVNVSVTDSVCNGLSAFRAKIFTITPNNTSLYTLNVTGPGGYNKTDKYTDTVVTAGVYTATMTRKSNGCTRSATFNIQVFPGCAIPLTGNVYDDGNGLLDYTVNAFGLGSLPGTTLYANLLYAAGTTVVQTTAVSGGTYTFPTVSVNTNYIIQLSTVQGVVSQPTPATTLPTNWVNTGENLGAGAGNDGSVNGFLPVSVATSAVSNANFGIDERPESNNLTMASQLNPGGTVQVTVDPLTGSDLEDGTKKGGNTLVFKSLGTNGNIYYNGNPISVGQVVTGFIPALLTADPTFAGAGTVTFNYVWRDSAGFDDLSDAVVTLPFTELSLTGKVWHDKTGLTDNLINGIGKGIFSSVQLYAYLLNSSNVIVDSSRVNPLTGTYSLGLIDANSNYKVRISSDQRGTNISDPGFYGLPFPWVGTGEQFGTNNAAGNGIETGAPNGLMNVTSVTSNISNVDFGIEYTPWAHDKTYYIIADSVPGLTGLPYYTHFIRLNSVAGSTDTTVNSNDSTVMPGRLSGFDVEDGRLKGVNGAVIDTTVFVTLPDANDAVLVYQVGNTNYLLIANPTVTDPSYIFWNPTLGRYEIPLLVPTNLFLFVHMNYQNSMSFQYLYTDSAGLDGRVATYTINSISLPMSISDLVCNKNTAGIELKWTAYELANAAYFNVLSANENGKFRSIGKVLVSAADRGLMQKTYQYTDNSLAEGNKYYRVEMVSQNGAKISTNICNQNNRVLPTSISVSLAPNPSNSNTVLQVSTPENLQLNIQITDLTGRVIMQTNYNANSTSNSILLNTESLKAGVYNVSVDWGTGNRVIKFVKQ